MYCYQALELKRNEDFYGAVQLYQKELKLFYSNHQKYGEAPEYASHDVYNDWFTAISQKYDEWSIGNVYYALGKAFYLLGEYDKAVASYLLNINSYIKDDYDFENAAWENWRSDRAFRENFDLTCPPPRSFRTVSDIYYYPSRRDESRDIVRHLGHALKDKFEGDIFSAIIYKNALSGDREAIEVLIDHQETQEEYKEIGSEAWVQHMAYLCGIDDGRMIDANTSIEINISRLLASSLVFRHLILD